MSKLVENIDCYAEPDQRSVLITLFENPIISKNFFLTGGTALSVFYHHHRVSMDLDLFTTDKVPLNEIYIWISRSWPGETVRVNQSNLFLQLLIKNIKVDFVIDPLSFKGPREKYFFDKKKFGNIDSLENIASNKFSALIGRREIKDFIDFYFINKLNKSMNPEKIYKDASEKEALFDDPPTVAFQLENNLKFIRENPDLFPEILIEFIKEDFYTFYESLIRKIYKKISI